MNKHLVLAAASILIMGLHGAAWAMDGGPDGGRQNMMKNADTNHDGKLSFDEFKAAHDKREQENFRKMDTNGDGFVDKDEARKGREMRRENMEERMEKRKEMRDKMKESKPQ